eukprot:TRINITY_DN3908_c0_g1_i2.p1 TRINITY_DN3908_c0_g1~~TRINITY_DN3908_c0_g1_i2.p1  ORF type:complete len:202 (+),score=39.26 TRINITY_DN3908_c0_g1_i2:7-612(+)
MNNHSFIYLETGELYALGDNTYGQLGINNVSAIYSCMTTMVMKDETIRLISVAQDHSFILKENGELIGFGKINSHEPLKGDNFKVYINDDKIRNVVSGCQFSLIIYENGDSYYFDSFERKPTFLFNENIKKIACGTGYVFQRENNEVVYKGEVIMRDTPLKKIVFGNDFFILLTENGEVYIQGEYLSNKKKIKKITKTNFY